MMKQRLPSRTLQRVRQEDWTPDERSALRLLGGKKVRAPTPTGWVELRFSSGVPTVAVYRRNTDPSNKGPSP